MNTQTHAFGLQHEVSRSVIPNFNATKQQDVQVRVHIIEARELKGRNMNGQSDPVCFVKVYDKEKHTSIQKKTTSCTWDHLFIFEFKLFAEEMTAGKISLEVFNANTIRRNELIGNHEIDIMQVYNSPSHELYRVWMALVDSENTENSGVQGYLKASITVLRDNDPIPAHNNTDDDDDSKDAGDSLQKMILLPPTIKTEEYYFNIRVYRGDNIPKMNLLAKPDTFIHVSFGGIKIKTSVVKSSQNPAWSEELKIPVTLPTLSDVIHFQLLDSNTVGADDIIATRYLRFSDVMNSTSKSLGPFWVNFYGSPYVVARSQTDHNMNKGLIEPTAYRGRVLVEMNVEKATNPKPLKLAAPPPRDNTQEQVYVLRLDLYEALELRIPAGRGLEKIEVEVIWGNNRAVSNTVNSHKASGASLTSNKRQAYWFEGVQELRCAYNTESIPDVFLNVYCVSIVGERTRLGLLHFKPEDIGINTPPKWMSLNPDLSLENELTKLFSPKNSFGYLLFKLSFGPGSEMTKITRPQIKRPSMHKYIVRCYLYQGRYLPAADGTGLSDPYCIVKVGPLHAETRVIKETLSPQWYEVVEIACELPDDLTLAPDINVYVWDYNAIQQHTKLGRFHVPMVGLGTRPSPITWYAIGDAHGQEGEVLASFQIFPAEDASKYPVTNITPHYKDCNVEISVVGLRGLMPFALLPIEHPYIEFDVGQTNDQGKKHSLKTAICSTPSGDNPNHLEVLTLPVKMPVETVFAPSITLRVYDKRVLLDPLIASTYIPLVEYIPWAQKPTLAKAEKENSGWFKSKQVAKEPSKRSLGTTKALPAPEPTPVVSGAGSINEDPAENEKTGLLSGEKGRGYGGAPATGATSSVSAVTAGDSVTIDMPSSSGPKEVVESDIADEEGKTMEKLPDEEEEEEKKEERPTLTGPLENEFKPAFQELTLVRGKKKGLNFFERIHAAINGPLQFNVGKFKGTCKVYETSTPNTPPNLRNMYRSQPYVIRVYILQGSGLIPKDMNGLSDPYIVVSVGKEEKQTVKDRDNHIKETLNPQFYKFYELPAMLPGNSELEIQIWDYNLLGGDELIGTTVIDLENRIFSDEWKGFPLKPIEWRSLWHPSSSNPQGQISLWVDIMTPQEASITPPVHIGPPVIKPFELRLVIWETQNVVFKDKTSSDVFFNGILGDVQSTKQETDIHWRCDDGNAKFNYRMVWPIELPSKVPRLKLQIWDKDILSPDDVIAEAVINLKAFCQKAYKTEKNVSSIPKQYISMYHPNQEGVQGKVEVQIDLVTKEEALANPVGKGRDEPNNHPFLPAPDRPETSFSPFRPDQYVQQIFWKKYKTKVYICLAICLLILMFPVIMFVKGLV